MEIKLITKIVWIIFWKSICESPILSKKIVISAFQEIAETQKFSLIHPVKGD